MPVVNLRIQTLQPSEPWWPDEDVLGERLVKLVKNNLATGAPTTGLVVRRETISRVPLKPFAEQKIGVKGVIAALARWDDGESMPDAVGVIGRVRWRRRNVQSGWSELAVVFIEWPDGRWWQWRGLLDADGLLLPESDGIARAVDGLARPSGLGGWWTHARRHKPNLAFTKRSSEDVPKRVGPVVN